MTTIAWDKSYLVGDGLTQYDGCVLSLNSEKVTRIPECASCYVQGLPIIAVGLAGQMSAWPDILNKMMQQLDYETKWSKEIYFTCLAITECKKAFLLIKNEGDERLDITLHEGVIAIGSGGKIALAALALGKSATEAIKLAIALDINTGGNITALDLSNVGN